MDDISNKKGTVKVYREDKGFGFIRGDDGDDRYFNIKNVKNKIVLKRKDRVTFLDLPSANMKKEAVNVCILKDEFGVDNTKLLERIKNEWKLEAQLENEIYFYNVEEIYEIIHNNKCFVIGRKGAGKTAIAKHLLNMNRFDTYTENIDFKNFPFNDIYQYYDSSFTYFNQYITIWKFIIYGSILRMMSLNERLDGRLLKSLREAFPIDSIDAFDRKFHNLTKTRFKIKFEPFSLDVDNQDIKEEGFAKTVSEQCRIFEDIIFHHIDNSKYFIIMDALDDDFNAYPSREHYISLLTSLFKAVQEIKGKFLNKRFQILPVIFLRDDIYHQINYSEKTKWQDLSVNLSWSEIKIKKMLAYRVMKSINPDLKALDFDGAWKKVFKTEYFNIYNSQKNIFDYITEKTTRRPRDYVQYLITCAQLTLSSGKVNIDSGIIFEAGKYFSKYLRQDYEMQLAAVLPEIKIIFNAIQQIGKPIFKFTEFFEKIEQFVSQGKLAASHEEAFLTTLFEYSIIGNQKKNNHIIFKHSSYSSELDINENIVVHEGLRSALYL
ncbi:MAG: cold shock domain-containing protein [Bacteroidetes bacterium]|nr:cold shock domain-containing protein [Bacteroidota bacterium]